MKNQPISSEWVLAQLAGMEFPEQGAAYDFMKKAIESATPKTEETPAGFVYKEVRHDDLEKMTLAGWEFVEPRASFTFMGLMAVYLVRRPRQKPNEMELNDKIASAQKEIEALTVRLEEKRIFERGFLAKLAQDLENYRNHLTPLKSESAKLVTAWLKTSIERIDDRRARLETAPPTKEEKNGVQPQERER